MSSPIYICGANVSCIVVLGTLQDSCVMGNGMVMECSCESSLPLVVEAMLTPAQSGVDLVFHAWWVTMAVWAVVWVGPGLWH